MVERLRRDAEVRAVLRRGRRAARAGLVVHALDRDDDGPTRVAVVASRRVGTAVARNRAKRVLRAAASTVPLPAGTDLALVARDGTGAASSVELAAQLRSVMEQMFDSPPDESSGDGVAVTAAASTSPAGTPS